MAYRGQGQKVQKVMVQPINLIFRYLQNRSRIQVWLYEQVNMRIEGCIIKFGEQGKLGVWGTVTLCHLSGSPEERQSMSGERQRERHRI
uniref:Small nuclear ribonucleoprotein E n=1 Tax=Felis catus TaxID=9685 RepID=A0ABI7YXV6_FELCA